MNRWFAACLLGLSLVTFAARAESDMRASKADVKKEIVAVVEAQLAAFRKGDAAKAYAFSATVLRQQKPLRVFSAIVKGSYPEIWANTGAEFGIVRDDGTHARLLVHVTAKNGAASYDYFMLKERAGWRIEGVLRHEPARNEKV